MRCFSPDRILKRKPEKVILHCAATPDVGPENPRWYELDISEVRRWHVSGNGWKDVGYHFFIRRDGTIQSGRKVGTPGAHTKGHNRDIGVCYAGSKYPTAEQISSLKKLAELIRLTHGISPLDWHGHYEYADKDCPGFKRDEIILLLTS